MLRGWQTAMMVGVFLAGGLLAVGGADAADNPFALHRGDPQVAEAEKKEEGAAGGEKDMKQGKCGEGKCGGDMEMKEGKGAKESEMKEGQCGEGKCGGDMGRKG